MRAVGQVRHQRAGDRVVVLGEVRLGEAVAEEQHPLGMVIFTVRPFSR